MTTIEATVLVCTRDRPHLVPVAVASVLAGAGRPAEVLVVDQSREPNPTLSSDRREGVRYLHRPGSGLAVARNIGFREAHHDVVALLDDDMTVDADWLRNLVAARTEPSGATTGRVLAAPVQRGQHPLPDAALITLDEPQTWRGRQRSDVLPGASVTLPRRLVLDLGGFDERLGAGTVFGSAEDNDLGVRLLGAGVEVRHVPEAIAWHRARDSAADDRRIRFAYGTGKGALHAKHVRDREMIVRLLRDAARRSARIARHLWRQPELARSEAVYLTGFATGFVRWWAGGWWRRPTGQSPD